MTSILSILDTQRQMIFNHEVVPFITMELLTRAQLDDMVKTFYADNLWWVAALQYMHKAARNDRFKQALHDNIRCETGADGGIAHTQMAENFISSIGLKVSMQDKAYNKAVTRAVEENNFLKKATEPTRAGFMLATEALFPIMLQIVRPVIVFHYPEADMQYIDEHIQVDADEHSQWMAQSVEQILTSGDEVFGEIVKGMEFALHGVLYPFECVSNNGLMVRL